MFEVMCCISCHVIVMSNYPPSIEGNLSEDRIFHLDLGRLPAFMFKPGAMPPSQHPPGSEAHVKWPRVLDYCTASDFGLGALHDSGPGPCAIPAAAAPSSWAGSSSPGHGSVAAPGGSSPCPAPWALESPLQATGSRQDDGCSSHDGSIAAAELQQTQGGDGPTLDAASDEDGWEALWG